MLLKLKSHNVSGVLSYQHDFLFFSSIVNRKSVTIQRDEQLLDYLHEKLLTTFPSFASNSFEKRGRHELCGCSRQKFGSIELACNFNNIGGLLLFCDRAA